MQTADNVDVFIVWKYDFEIRDEGLTDLRRKKRLAQAGEWIARSVSWSDGEVAVRTNHRRRPLASEELVAMAIQAGLMFGKVGYVRKSFLALPHLLPIL
jgi:hypothetical protein